jgi:transcriptional regulator with XRE-family HTH domain
VSDQTVNTRWAATSGLPELDAILGGIYWGDNVVWELDQDTTVEPFFQAVARDTAGYHFAAYVTLATPPDVIRETYPSLAVIDARPGSELAQPGALMSEIRRRCRRFERDLLLFDPMEKMVELWGADRARRFYVRCCPMLLELGTIAYWSLSPASTPLGLRRAIEQMSQCLLSLGPDRVRVAKADGRPPRVEGAVLRYELANGSPALTDAPTIARLGAALRSVRDQRGLTQTELGRMAGISSSAVSQAERGQRGLAFETLLDLTEQLGISLDDLMRGQVTPGYRLARRHDPLRRDDDGPHAMLDDPRAGMRAHLVRLQPGVSGSADIDHEGVQMIAVATGLVQVTLTDGLPVLREGEVLMVEDARISGWRNLSEHEAMFFWILRDERPERRA